MTAVTGRPWTDPHHSVEERVQLLLGVMTLPEKAGQLTQVAHPDL